MAYTLTFLVVRLVVVFLAIAFDKLVNALQQFSQEHVQLKQVIVGGQNDDWKIEP